MQAVPLSTTTSLNSSPSPNHLAQRNKLNDLEPKCFIAVEDIFETNSKETMKTEAQKVTKLAKEKYSVLKDTLITTFVNIYSLLSKLY